MSILAIWIVLMGLSGAGMHITLHREWQVVNDVNQAGMMVRPVSIAGTRADLLVTDHLVLVPRVPLRRRSRLHHNGSHQLRSLCGCECLPGAASRQIRRRAYVYHGTFVSQQSTV